MKTPLIIEAFKNINRADFVPTDLKDEVGVNAPLPIGFEQTISQPLTVAFMLELLQPQRGDKILDIGSGSGWTSALLAWCVGGDVIARSEATKQSRGSITGLPRYARDDKKEGKVFAVERIKELHEFGKNNISKYTKYNRFARSKKEGKSSLFSLAADYNFIDEGIIEFICADGSRGLPEQAPFNKILVSAAADEIPLALKEQLAVNGRLVMPVKNSIWLVVKKSDNEFMEEEFYGFSFVPLVSQ